jgi:uncharacterized protein (UPF0548 family)
VRFGCIAVAPSDGDLRALLTEQELLSPTFRWLGATTRDERVPGYKFDQFTTVIGDDEQIWARAKDALTHWRPQRGAGLRIYPPGVSVEVGATVLVVGGVLGVAMLAACRVVNVIDEPDRFGYVYATLPLHPECGEEAMYVERDNEGVVRFELRVLSELRDPIARLGGPVSRRMQAAATRRYIEAMKTV